MVLILYTSVLQSISCYSIGVWLVALFLIHLKQNLIKTYQHEWNFIPSLVQNPAA